jgi:ABC-type nitrate/sulfonate/bicarbonate transport system permease component
MAKNERALHAPFKQPPARVDLSKIAINLKKRLYQIITFGILLLLWHMAACHYDSQLVLPTPWHTFKALIFALQDAHTLQNLALTIKRVMLGLGIALMIGLTVGFAMGYSQIIHNLVDPVIGPLRQVPIMAWVPLTIVWFGLGDGPTLFLIAMVATFPILLNTMAGVRSVPLNYYHAARSMGAGRLSIFTRVTLPGAMPDMITGLRIGLSAGWMSVI